MCWKRSRYCLRLYTLRSAPHLRDQGCKHCLTWTLAVRLKTQPLTDTKQRGVSPTRCAQQASLNVRVGMRCSMTLLPFWLTAPRCRRCQTDAGRAEQCDSQWDTASCLLSAGFLHIQQSVWSALCELRETWSSVCGLPWRKRRISVLWQRPKLAAWAGLRPPYQTGRASIEPADR